MLLWRDIIELTLMRTEKGSGIMPHAYIIFLVYLAIISAVAVMATLSDKSAAKRGSRRVKEQALLLISALGGSVAMLVTMKGARHKTKHAKFMVGIPVIIVLQVAAVFFVWRQFIA